LADRLVGLFSDSLLSLTCQDLGTGFTGTVVPDDLSNAELVPLLSQVWSMVYRSVLSGMIMLDGALCACGHAHKAHIHFGLTRVAHQQKTVQGQPMEKPINPSS